MIADVTARVSLAHSQDGHAPHGNAARDGSGAATSPAAFCGGGAQILRDGCPSPLSGRDRVGGSKLSPRYARG
ncbi:hypothetical protein [Hoyosella altamirensis]|uniref:Uncharacterized protein n=1 Tax=Hoyosella altamirensis TaxID=616997 RepID=A0A839RRH0_9ACTN|nr:hypothetical protein [Hoyosella altamirensis]MBB3038471.1 hypothetical protein [Hoyosella altamirensis]